MVVDESAESCGIHPAGITPCGWFYFKKMGDGEGKVFENRIANVTLLAPGLLPSPRDSRGEGRCIVPQTPLPLDPSPEYGGEGSKRADSPSKGVRILLSPRTGSQKTLRTRGRDCVDD